ncbi:iron complex transport system ATP-binding protein [Wenyingzhuangia heitensis]|uniref:Iron complex transport system ATP-binding protein n=1 Tax=Wenyingzhuangia heitensis TaxID=1487859 RepID=A0ABX0UGP8_9FLAO|nr:ABC transporter ATP-binding protein [Wenyingzhuangia heitensis]NIJ46187.1 iron complex transport system ATP-binding protein [Wenyingzhuangia heitensis]
MSNTVLNLENIAIGYQSSKKEHIICRNIYFNLYQGELVCLLGRNGSGKSTLLKTIANMLPTLQGSITINQIDYSNLSALDFAKNISIVLTESLPENSLTVFETIALGRQPYTNWLGKITEEDEQIVLNAMELTDTVSLKNNFVNQLSDGQLQRVMIARALAQDTPIILLDEPTSHLDIHHKINIFKILRKISKETQKTILISTHEINLALKNSDRLLLIDNHTFSIGNVQESKIQDKLTSIFNSDDIKYDAKSNQFIF